jgi:phenylalanyl-tRNA synthetase alpha chain
MLEELLNTALSQINSAESLKSIQDYRAQFLGKSSVIQKKMSLLGSLNEAERKKQGQEINAIREQITHALQEQTTRLQEQELAQQFARESLDVSIPARPRQHGSIHPITQTTEELIQIFAQYGFEVKDGPSIENTWYNFDALNIPENHPARQMQDSFYLKGKDGEQKLLRTHTSPIQIRTMEQEQPPHRFIAPGRVYRCDYDVTHTPMFHQIEGMVIDENINMGHLKYIIIDFIKQFFQQNDIEIRFRPSFFPFTEPSAEVDIRMTGSDNWLEVLGCGMVHPNVLRNVGIDQTRYQGFAFGLGIDRFAMLKYGIKDLRQFFEGDMRWLNHYSFAALDIPSLVGGLTK